MAKAPRLVKYRVKKKAFVGGSLRHPGTIVEAEEGLEGAALELLKADPKPGNENGSDPPQAA